MKTFRDGDILRCYRDKLRKDRYGFRETNVCYLKRGDMFFNPGNFQYIDLSHAYGEYLLPIPIKSKEMRVNFRFDSGEDCKKAEHECKQLLDDYWGISMKCESSCLIPAKTRGIQSS